MDDQGQARAKATMHIMSQLSDANVRHLQAIIESAFSAIMQENPHLAVAIYDSLGESICEATATERQEYLDEHFKDLTVMYGGEVDDNE